MMYPIEQIINKTNIRRNVNNALQQFKASGDIFTKTPFAPLKPCKHSRRNFLYRSFKCFRFTKTHPVCFELLKSHLKTFQYFKKICTLYLPIRFFVFYLNLFSVNAFPSLNPTVSACSRNTTYLLFVSANIRLSGTIHFRYYVEQWRGLATTCTRFNIIWSTSNMLYIHGWPDEGPLDVTEHIKIFTRSYLPKEVCWYRFTRVVIKSRLVRRGKMLPITLSEIG